MALLRQNKDPLMAVLDAFVHDPLTEWVVDKANRDRKVKAEHQKKQSEHLQAQARNGKSKGKGKAVEGAGGGAGKADGADAMDVDPTEPMELDDFAREALTRIEKKLEGLFCPYMDDKALEAMGSTVERVVPTNSLVDMLIREASSKLNLVCRIPSCSNESGPLTRIVRE